MRLAPVPIVDHPHGVDGIDMMKMRRPCWAEARELPEIGLEGERRRRGPCGYRVNHARRILRSSLPARGQQRC